jgi:hypothetical protein
MTATRTLLAVGPVFAAVLATSVANADPSAMHAVKYLVYSDVPTTAQIYYRDTKPPNWGDYSHDLYQYSPKVDAEIGPGAPWTLDTALSNPGQWAMVVVTNELSSGRQGFRCELMVDGVIAATNTGPKGALCSLRQW